MKEKIIPILFQEYLVGRMSSYDFDDYELNSSSKVQRSLLDGLSKENAADFFEGTASRIHESSHRDVFYYHHIRCNFLHIAIQLNEVACVEQLLNEYNVSPIESLVYTYSREQTDNDNDTDRESEKEEKTTIVSPVNLAKDKPAILFLINTAIQRKSQSKAMAAAAEDLEEYPTAPSDFGYDADADEKAPKEIKYKKRLILGDGNLSYSRALLQKRQNANHANFSGAMTVTEYNSENALKATYTAQETNAEFRNFQANVDALRERGAEVILGVDARNIHSMFNDRRFKRIHFNFPYYHDSSLSPAANKAKTRELVGDFFKSATQIQQPGDRIHMGLVTGFTDQVWYENATYGVAEFCETYGYVYIKKRNFIDSEKGLRYPGYVHVKTSSGQSVSTAETGREFIFEKKIPGKQYEHSSQKKKTTRSVEHPVLKSRDTDSDSSSYVEHSDDESNSAPISSFGKIPDSAVKAKAPLVATTLTLGGTVSTHEKAKASKEQALVATDSSFKRK
jgi:hypothetical protein